MKILLATHNANKAEEIRALLPHVEFVTLKELNDFEEIIEDGATLQENALIKARAGVARHNLPCLADDTGLLVDALDGAPGVYSARYAGEPANAENNMSKLLQELDGEENRNAAFETILVFVDDSEVPHVFSGKVEGAITESRSGSAGFGYDPIFTPKGYQQTFAQMSREEKGEISHRGRALQKFKTFIGERL